MRTVGERQKTEAENFPFVQLAFVLHPVAPREHAETVVAALSEFTIVSRIDEGNEAPDRSLPCVLGPVGIGDGPESGEETIFESTAVLRLIVEDQITEAMPLAVLVPFALIVEEEESVCDSGRALRARSPTCVL